MSSSRSSTTRHRDETGSAKRCKLQDVSWELTSVPVWEPRWRGGGAVVMMGERVTRGERKIRGWINVIAPTTSLHHLHYDTTAITLPFIYLCSFGSLCWYSMHSCSVMVDLALLQIPWRSRKVRARRPCALIYILQKYCPCKIHWLMLYVTP